MTDADARFTDGWQYGVRFSDNSVAAPWNGATQRQRAEEYLAYLRDRYPRDTFALARRRRGAAWEAASCTAS